MFQELNEKDYARVRPLFQGFDYSTAIQAALAGNSPCHIFVDDTQHPHVGLALTVEGYLLAGDGSDPHIQAALREFLRESIFTGKVYIGMDWWMTLAVDPPIWENYLPAIIPTHEAEKVLCYQYQCRKMDQDWRAHLPAGYRVYPLSAVLNQEIEAKIPEELYDDIPIEAHWGTLEHFISAGMGFCAVAQELVVAWCKANCVVGEQIEVGVNTLAAHRRQGLATAVTAFTVARALEQGFRVVNWQCDHDNIASRKTAEKVGFEKVREYFYYDYIYDLGDQYAQLGWRAFHNGEYEKCVRYYQQAFAFPRENGQSRLAASDYYYAAVASTAQGNSMEAWKYMEKATKMGWKATVDQGAPGL